jgi:hypothetical protein
MWAQDIPLARRMHRQQKHHGDVLKAIKGYVVSSADNHEVFPGES